MSSFRPIADTLANYQKQMPPVDSSAHEPVSTD